MYYSMYKKFERSNYTSGPLMRTMTSGNLDGNETNRVLRIDFDPNMDNDSTHFQDGSDIPNTANDDRLYTNAGLRIGEYSLQVATNGLIMLHQWYGDQEDYAVISGYEPTQEEWHFGTKQTKMIGGHKQTYATEWQNSSFIPVLDGIDVTETYWSNDYKIGTLRFNSNDKKSLKPIELSRYKGDTMGFSITELAGNDDTYYYAFLKINKWSTQR